MSAEQTSPPRPVKPRKRFRLLRWLVVVVLLLGISGELVARYYLGLGDPPVSVADSEIEYLFKPSQDVSRFGNRIKYNAYSMRSDDFPREKASAEEVRVLVLGDSVVNGGNQIDQRELGTELLKAKLTAELGKPVTVGNISAGSWGPGNLLAYLKRHGLFDADAVVLVISSHDAADVPDFKPIVGVSPDFPDKKPILALEELVFRYLPRYLPGKATPAENLAEEPEATAFTALGDLEKLIELIQKAGVPLVILQHPTREELAEGYDPGHDAIADLAKEMQVPTIELAPYLQAAIDAGQNVYRDKIHPNAQGQAVLAKAMEKALLEKLELD